MAKKKEPTKSEVRARRTQQVLSIAIGVIVILSMVIGMFAQ